MLHLVLTDAYLESLAEEYHAARRAEKKKARLKVAADLAATAQ